MGKKWIFRRIRGRIVPIKVKSGSTPKMDLKNSAKIRSALKKKAAKKKDIFDQRIDAIQDVRDVVKSKKNFGLRPVDGGSDVDVFKPRKPGNIVKAPILQIKMARDRLLERLQKVTRLEKSGLAPRSFLVETKDSSYLVQKEAKTIAPLQTRFVGRNEKQIQRITKKHRGDIERLRQRGAEAGVNVLDINESNTGFLGKKKKFVSIDSGDSGLNPPTDNFRPGEVDRLRNRSIGLKFNRPKRGKLPKKRRK